MSSVMWDGPGLAEYYDRVSGVQFKTGCTLVGRMKIREGDHVLDIGCGTGRLALYVSKIVGPSGYVAGIDPSPHRIKIADRKCEASGVKNVRFAIGQGEDLSALSESSYDHAYYSSVFHWIPDKPRALDEAYRVLRQGGNVGITTIDRDHQLAMRRSMDDLFARDPYKGRVQMDDFSKMLTGRKELNELLSAAGFCNIDIEMVEEKQHYSSPEELLEFIEASSFGNFLRNVPDDLRQRARNDMKKELDKIKTDSGIELRTNMIYAIAVKP